MHTTKYALQSVQDGVGQRSVVADAPLELADAVFSEDPARLEFGTPSHATCGSKTKLSCDARNYTVVMSWMDPKQVVDLLSGMPRDMKSGCCSVQF